VAGEALANEIFVRSIENLSSQEFAERSPMGMEYEDSQGRIKAKIRKWTITNAGELAKSMYKKGNKRDLRWEVGSDAPYAHANNYGHKPKWIDFDGIYEWVWKRRKEIKRDFASMKVPPRSDKGFWRLYEKKTKYIRKIWTPRTKGKGRRGKKTYETDFAPRSVETKLMAFAYYVWLDIKKNGLQPSFFFSDAVWTTQMDARSVVKRALEADGRFRVVS